MDKNNIRNFVIISHIDHGKSTLADRFLELTHTIEDRKMKDQLLDSMDLERERGITIKMAPVQMKWSDYTLNLIDTPGHVDFSYEVSRALAAVEGAVLLVDGTKGVQAQTLAHLSEAQKQNIVIIPVINKIDLPATQVEGVEEEIRALLPEVKEILKISAKKGDGVKELLERVIKKVPAPDKGKEIYGRALVFDSQYDSYKGVLAYIRVVDGKFKRGDKIKFLAQDKTSEIVEVGFFKPQLKTCDEIEEGAIGYVATGIKEPEVVRVGDTLVATALNSKSLLRGTGRQITNYKSLSGYKEPKPVVFASIFPAEGVEIDELKDAFSRLKLTDSALSYELESSDVLGQGFRCGFLGSLHLEIILERLRREFNLRFIATTPSVEYQIKNHKDETLHIYNPSEFPESNLIKEISEPWIGLTLFLPKEYLGGTMDLLQKHRSIYKEIKYLTTERVEIIYEMPLAEIISDFYDKLKSISSGFASMSYDYIGHRPGDLVKINILVAGEEVEALAKIVPRERAYNEGRKIVKKLKDYLPRELFTVSIQAAIGGKIIARETLSALKKDVTSHLYGGDITRKMKLREKQKKGKKKMKKSGRVNIPDHVFQKLLKD